MKRHGYLFEKVIEKENIRRAITKAAKDKKDRPEVKKVLADIPGHVDKIHDMLKNKTYVHCIPELREVREGSSQKKRTVTIIDFFPDQIVHWAATLVVTPIIMRSSYVYSCGSMPGRGPHYGKKHTEKWITNDPRNTKYVAKLDIKKFYGSIKPSVMKEFLRTKIKDKNMLWLFDLILDSFPSGLAIGYLPSQWNANKKRLHRAVRSIMEFLKGLGLKLKENWQVFLLDSRALDFMGFRFFRNRTILRKALMLRITRRAKKVHRKGEACAKCASAVISYMGWIKHTRTYQVYSTYIKPLLSIRFLKTIIRKFSKGEIKKYDYFKIRKRPLPAAA